MGRQEVYFPRFFKKKKKKAADFDYFVGGGDFYFWEWFFHSFAHKKLTEEKALVLTRGEGRGEMWLKGKRKKTDSHEDDFSG